MLIIDLCHFFIKSNHLIKSNLASFGSLLLDTSNNLNLKNFISTDYTQANEKQNESFNESYSNSILLFVF